MSCKEITGAFSVCQWIFSKKKKKKKESSEQSLCSSFHPNTLVVSFTLKQHVFTSHQAFLNTQNDNDSCNIVHNTALYQLCREKKTPFVFHRNKQEGKQ